MDETQSLISPEDLEKAMVKQAAEQPLGNPEDQAAAMFQKHAQRLVGYVQNMSKKELQRIILHAGLHPLFTNHKTLKNEAERTAAYDLEQLVQCKVIMSVHIAAEDAKIKDQELLKGKTVAEEPAQTVAEATGENNV